MQKNLVKQKLQAGQRAFGTMIFEFATPGIARIAAQAGAEFAVFDMEHTGWSVETIKMLIATSRAASLAPFVRVPATEYHFIARVLDMGALGVMSPMVESAEQARRLVASAKYPPQGRRGAAFGIAHDDYTGGNLVEKVESANRESLLIAQIETAAGVEHAEAIAAVEGIDVLWIGQYDLSLSLGTPGQFEHPRMEEAMAHVLAACKKHGKAAGIMPTDIAGGKAVLDQGFRIVAYSGDLWIMQAALRDGIKALRGHVE
jgi:2-dehydro-3-deoxyglucarate aldolase/4-hydroxy-2-oxoheptanedioate aldolase